MSLIHWCLDLFLHVVNIPSKCTGVLKLTEYESDTPVSMNVKSVWEAGYTGEGILVAVVDDGVRITRPDLKPNIISCPKPGPTVFTYDDGSCASNTNGYSELEYMEDEME